MYSAFKISEKLHYAFIITSNLAKNYQQNQWLSLQDVAQKYGLSHGYLEEIVATLRRADIVTGRRGSGGGYRLSRPPRDISYAAVIEAFEKHKRTLPCPHCVLHEHCQTETLLNDFQNVVKNHFERKTLGDYLPKKTV